MCHLVKAVLRCSAMARESPSDIRFGRWLTRLTIMMRKQENARPAPIEIMYTV
jgi:hypothetical protein